MTTPKPFASASSVAAAFVAVIALFSLIPPTDALGSGSTIAVASDTATICGIAAGQSTRNIVCHRNSPGNQTLLTLLPNISFSVISGGRTNVCGLTADAADIILCWDTQSPNTTLFPRRIYYNLSRSLQTLAVGNYQVCALVNETQYVQCWSRKRRPFQVPPENVAFSSISSGFGFSCGITANSSNVRCWGSNGTGSVIQSDFGSTSMSGLVVGGSHACGINGTGFVVCEGNNNLGQLDVPAHSAMEFSSLSLGANHTCAIRQVNRTVVCWGGGGGYSVSETQGISFELLASGYNFTCGLVSENFSVLCWGPGRPSAGSAGSLGLQLPFPGILPGPCVRSSCEYGIYSQSESLCSGSGKICSPRVNPILPPPPIVPPQSPPTSSPSPPSPSKTLRKGLLAFAIVGSIGSLAGIVTVVYCLWSRACFRRKKVHNSVQPTMTRDNSSALRTSSNSPPMRPLTIRRQSSRAMRRQRSGTSSKNTDRAEEFTFAYLAAATDNFSLKNKIGSGSFGVVYRGKLPDGREVAIKRGETGTMKRKFQEKESAFESELAFLSRLHHKHLVRLVGYCQENDERLLVYDHMKNGALYDHLHSRDNVEKGSSLVNSWKMRIKIALDAARGVDYLHNYAVPPIIHRDIKSSNILLDASWTARVSDLGLSLLGPDADQDLRPSKAAGTVGYIDPEYYGLNVLTMKSDVYGLGVVLLELLTGKRAIFRNGEDGGTPISVVDYAVPIIATGELGRILDRRVGLPELNETEAIELMAYIALRCVNLEGKDRPTMTDIVANLERALALCGDSHGSISTGSITAVSE